MQKIYPADVRKRKVIAVLIYNRHVIHIESDDRVVHPGSEASDVDG